MIRLQVEQVANTPVIERYKVTARNTSFTLQTNRPLIRNKGLKHKPADWKEVAGTFNNSSVLESIIKAIEAKLKES